MTLYVTDLDGTLLRNDKSVSDYTKNTLNSLMEKGVLFTYATARSFASAAPLVKALNLTCPAVVFNGVFVVDPQTGARLIENTFTKKSLKTARDFIIKEKYAPLVYSFIDGEERVSYLAERFENVADYVRSRPGDRRLRPAADYRELFAGDVFYITVLNPKDTKPLDSVFTAENGFSRNVQPDTYDDTVWYEIYDKRAGKAAAALRVKELVKADKMVCFGDNNNDLSMLEAADAGAAVSNACAELRERADIIIESNENDAVARFIERRESELTDGFRNAVEKALKRVKSNIGTQNEKVIHAALKNYYAPFADEQEVKIGSFYADAVGENGICEIQTRQLYKLRPKLEAFLAGARVNVVHPFICEMKTLFINADTGEITKTVPARKKNSLVDVFEELYSLRDMLQNENLTITIARLKAEKRVYYHGSELPDLRGRNARKKCVIEKIPTELLDEMILKSADDYRELLPCGLPGIFTKKEFCAAAGETSASLRLEVLRAAGVIEKTGQKGRAFLYSVVRS